MGESFIKWSYCRPGLPWFAPILFGSHLLSTIYGCYQDSAFSRRRIKKMIQELQIDESEFLDPTDSFPSFNAFFTRKLKPECRPYDSDPRVLVAPADGRLLVYPQVKQDQVYPIKGTRYSLNRLIPQGAADFYYGHVIVIRLCPADYHRFHFPCAGTVASHTAVPGSYYSVNPIALAHEIAIFAENKRCCTLLDTEYFGRVAILEIGAFGVGSIQESPHGREVKKMEEKGYFQFGGSTIVLVFQPNRLRIAPDLVANSQKGYETLVKVGETIGLASA